jgi:hypothetical protein
MYVFEYGSISRGIAPMLAEGEYAFFGLFAAFIVLVLLGIAHNLQLFPPMF